MTGFRMLLLAAAALALAGCETGFSTGAEATRAWACAPDRTLSERQTALASANAWRAFWGQPERLAHDCNGDGRPDFGPGSPEDEG